MTKSKLLIMLISLFICMFTMICLTFANELETAEIPEGSGDLETIEVAEGSGDLEIIEGSGDLELQIKEPIIVEGMNNIEEEIEKAERDIILKISEEGGYDIRLSSNGEELPFSLLYIDEVEYVGANFSKKDVYLFANEEYIVRLQEKFNGYNNIKIEVIQVSSQAVNDSESFIEDEIMGGGDSDSDYDNIYRQAYLSIHNNDGSFVDGWQETYAYNLLYNADTSSYNGVATSTGGKVPGTETSFYVGVENGVIQYSTNATITISADTTFIWRDGRGTEDTMGRDVVRQISGYVEGLDGKIYVETTWMSEITNGLQQILIPIDKLSKEDQEKIKELVEETEAKKADDKEIDVGDGTALGHISMSQNYITFTNIPGETETRVYSNEYDISKGIPTSEYLTIYGKAPKALYTIVVRETTITAWNDPVKIQGNADYLDYIHYDRWIKVGRNKWKVRHNYYGRCDWYRVNTGGITGQGELQNYTDTKDKKFYDVVTSNIYALQNVKITETNEIYSNYKLETTTKMDGIGGPGPSTLTFDLKRPDIKATYNLDNEGYYGYDGGAAYSAAGNTDGSAGKAAVASALENAILGSVKGTVNYSFAGLTVTKTGYSGAPNPGFSEVTDKILIPESYPNGRYIPYGAFNYAGYGEVVDIPEEVYVHTPVVNTASITSTSKYINQKINVDSSKLDKNYYLMLDEEFTITIPNSGVHRNIKGYGNRRYNSKQGHNDAGKKATTWAKLEEVRFPFDIYVDGSSGKKYFLPAGQWMSAQSWWNTALNDITKWSASVGTQYTFTIPVWVTEQTYTRAGGNAIEVRVVAENAFGDKNIDAVNHLNETNNYQYATANTNINKYVATQYIDCEIIGKIYDLRVSASNDPGWQDKIYSWSNKTEYIATDEFPFGSQGQNKITQYKYAPKLGYSFIFDFKTKGRKSNEVDATILPTISASGFYYVDKNGGQAKKVDLYYRTTTNQYVKIGSGTDNVTLSTRLNDSYLKVQPKEFTDSNRIYNLEAGINKVYNYNLAVNIGKLTKMTLPHSLRLCYDNFAEYVGKLYGTNSNTATIAENATINGMKRGLNGRDNVIGSVGHWYAGYRLPNTTVAIDPTTMTLDEAIKTNGFLKDGYIIVKMDIKTKYNVGTNSYDYLRYLGPEAINEATGDNTGVLEEDFTKDTIDNPIKLPNGKDAIAPHGPIVIYDGDMRASNDAEVGGTH